jgi:hypothetical protein
MNGGAIASIDSGLVVDYTTFANNTIAEGKGSGGQLYVYSNFSNQKAAAVSHVSFFGKQNLTGDGGTIYFDAAGTFTETCTDRAQGMLGYSTTGLKADFIPITDVDVLKDSAARNGGFLYLGGGANATIARCQIQHNTAHRDGGAFYVTDASKLYLDSVFLRGNKARRGGGAFVGGKQEVTTTSTEKLSLLRADASIGLGNVATEAGENIFNDNQVVKLKCGDLHLNNTNRTSDVSVAEPMGGLRGAVGGYRLNSAGCTVPTPNPTAAPSPLPTSAPTFYPSPLPTTAAPTPTQ